jgi:hypothetical protein
MGSGKRKEGIPETKNIGQGEEEIKLEITEEERKMEKKEKVVFEYLLLY